MMTLLSVVACDKLYQQLPSVSRAPSTDSRGVIVRSVTDDDSFFGIHAFRMKQDSLSQVSSKLITLLPFSSSLSNAMANCYRRMRQRAELLCTGTFFTMR